MKCDIFLMILNSKKHEGQIPKLELALLFQISLLLYLEQTWKSFTGYSDMVKPGCGVMNS